ncbi:MULTISPECIES: helix-turn-helix domain-containing protein [Streptomyces]|uniref:Transcriptional regulator n=1 Tax=Streptomyces clavifer TaxID=68188 RepID=A0ABS4VIX4_9ACTN|nr:MULTISPECIES: helix-turn-helix domain-containing protein [Streptomyces]MBP2363873.1 putative transcriptional regulator [Streptomyces clavifer]MDX2744683.1 transcriptional regulator [Streptomyces sp. NRRL_B-2557]GHB08971.1 transcriptional regulator [Streptomyces clavifer]
MATGDADDHAVEVHLDRLPAERRTASTEPALRVGVTNASLSVLKNGRAKAMRSTTLTRVGTVLGGRPGGLLSYPGGRD